MTLRWKERKGKMIKRALNVIGGWNQENIIVPTLSSPACSQIQQASRWWVWLMWMTLLTLREVKNQ